MSRIVLSTSLPLFGAVCYTAYSNRPVYPIQTRVEASTTIGQASTISAASTTVVKVKSEVDKEFLRTGLYSPSTDQEPWILKLSRASAITSVTALSRLLLEVLNDFRIAGNKEHHDYLMNLIREGKNRNRGMITVSNHTSVFDDPVLQSCLTSFIHPDLMRWGVCKESICFSNSFAASFTGAGKVLPIKVGGGVEQVAFKAVGRRLTEAEWIHIYPEAACIQSGSLGKGQFIGCRKEDKAAQVGMLKWGVGKLAARTAFQDGNLPPIIIPYYHTGMEKVKPQKNLPDTNGLVDPWYIPGRIGNQIRVFVGPPVEVDDLIKEYEKKTGKKRRIARIMENNEFQNWDSSTEEEFELYSKITKRVEDALLKLEIEAREYEKLRSQLHSLLQLDKD
jgi:monolysocardiolipin acyltransferase